MTSSVPGRSVGDESARFMSILLRHLLNPEQVEVLGLHLCPAPAASPLVNFLKVLIRISTDVFDEADTASLGWPLA